MTFFRPADQPEPASAPEAEAHKAGRHRRIAAATAWLLALSLFGGLLIGRPEADPGSVDAAPETTQTTGPRRAGGLALMPQMLPTKSLSAVQRRSELHTAFPERGREEVITYTVARGDSVFEIAAKFKLQPETVLWGNYALLNDNPDLIAVGMDLLIPPVDGVLYKWQTNDDLAGVAARFETSVEAILNWPGNRLDLIDPQLSSGDLVMVVGGRREFRQWLIPTIPRGSAGVAASVYGGGACEGGYEGAYGTGTFVWPAANHILSGNDYWPGHLAIDIAAGDGASIFAADSGVVVFAGWANGGYGNTVIVDHGNGYQTLYAHMSSVTARCGQSLGQGSAIGVAGSTGNSTGTHLHFEVRYLGGFISPWYVLPAP